MVLAAAVIAVPVFKRLGLSSILGYLAAGVVIGPYVLGIFTDPDQILHFAELGVVLLLFIIGLELRPSRLWRMRIDILGLGLSQIVICTLVLYVLANAFGLTWQAALVAGFALALSSTAFGIQLLQERGQFSTTYGQKAFAILLAQDLAIIPALALLPLLSPAAFTAEGFSLQTAAIIAAILVIFALLGRFINPVFGFLAKSNAREIMTAAALLIVFGAAAAMDAANLSMGLGAFLAGVILSESNFRHELEADIEPFRGLLLALFFMAVGMSLELDVVAANWLFILVCVPVFMLIKGALIWGVVRLFANTNADAMRVAVTLPQGGEFGFVLFTAALGLGILSPPQSALLTAIVTLSMALTPVGEIVFNALARRFVRRGVSQETIQPFEGTRTRVILCGFGRFGQIAAQMLIAEGVEITAIDHDAERIKAAARFGFKVYYGDVTRPDILRAAGAGNAAIIAVCLGDQSRTRRVIEVVRKEFPNASLFVRAVDRAHAIELKRLGVDYEIRETFESGIVFGRAALEHLGIAPERIETIETDVRERDEERLRLQADGNDFYAGMDMLKPRIAPSETRTARPAPATGKAKAEAEGNPRTTDTKAGAEDTGS